MTRRLDLDESYRIWLRDIGTQIANARARMGWTQSRASEQCGLDVKQYQDIEHGRRPLSTRTLFSVAAGLRVPPDELTRSAHPKSAHTSTIEDQSDQLQVLASLRSLGWKVFGLDTRPRPARTMVVHDLGSTVQQVGGPPRPAVQGWALPPADRRVQPGSHFVAQVHGEAMAPHIPNGAWCVFRQPVTAPLLGKLVLVPATEGKGAAAGEGAFVVRRVGALSLTANGVDVRLDALAGDVAPRLLQLANEAELEAFGELVRVEA